MKLTEKMLLDGYDGITNGIAIISKTQDKKIIWNVREDQGNYQPVCAWENADYILLEYDRAGRIELDASHKNHPNVAQIKSDIEKIVGTEV